MLYVKLLKALYGLLKSALLFYKKLAGELVNMGFEINPYDPCVDNKTVNGIQMTVTWYVDDLTLETKIQKLHFLVQMLHFLVDGW